MNLEEGMYARSDNGMKFGKVIEVHKFNNRIWYKLNNGVCIDSSELISKKISNNIINLVEIGDYVDGNKVANIVEENEQRYLVLDRDEVFYDSCLEPSSDDDIKSIVTKEQFSQMEYKVGE